MLSPFVHGVTTVPGSTTSNEIGGDGVWYDTSLKASLKSHQVFGRFDYDLTDTTHFYFSTAYNHKVNTANVFWQNLNQVNISRTNAFLPTAIQALIPTTQPTFSFSKQMSDLPRQATNNVSKMVYFNTGLEGEVGKYKWEVGFVHGQATLVPTLLYNTNNAKRAASLDAARDAAGNIVCNVTSPTRACIPAACR